MTKKQRHAIYEGVAIILAGFGGMFTVPELMNAHQSNALLAAGILFVGWLTWLAYFLYRNRNI